MLFRAIQVSTGIQSGAGCCLLAQVRQAGVPSDAQVAIVSLMACKVDFAQGIKQSTTNLKLLSVCDESGISSFLCLQRCCHQSVHVRS